MPNDLLAQPKDLLQGPKDLIQSGPVDLKTDSGPRDLLEPDNAMPFSAEHPNLYGAYGAVKETGKTLLPWVKYFDPEEREQFVKLDKQHQVRELLYEDLNFVLLGQGGALAKSAKYLGGSLAKVFPKTANVLTKIFNTPIGKKSQTVGQKVASYKRKHGEVPPSHMIEDWWNVAAGKTIKTPAAKVEAMYSKADVAAREARRAKSGEVLKTLKRKFVDVSGNVKKQLLKEGDAGKKAIIRHDLIAGASQKSALEFKEIKGAIFDGLSRQESEYLNRVIQSRRTIAIENYKNIKHPEGLGADAHTEWLKSLPTELYQKVNARADGYFKAMRVQLDKLRTEGLIGKEAYETLVKAGDYSPRKFIQHIDPDKSFSFGGKPITVPDSGIKRLSEGSEGLLERDAETLLFDVISRTDARIARNKANQSLFELAKSSPDSGIVSVAKVAKKSKSGKLTYQEAPAGHTKIGVIVNGQKQEMIMPNEIAKEWVMRDPEISQQYANFIGWLSGAKILRPMATGLNPEFALSNLPRDIAHAWLTTQEYSAFAPKAALQIGKDLALVAKDAALKKGAWKAYIKEGGGMEFLTHQGRVTKSGGIWGKIQNFLGYAGETSESMMRLALRRRALANGKTTEEATWIARNYLDFSQGGSFAKAADAAIPYLNASIQGTRGIFRAAAQKPGVTAFKAAQIMTAATGLYMANRTQNKDCWDQISDRDKVNNWIITTPFSFEDKDGTKRHVYFRIAKDQGQRVLATVAENLMGKYMGENINGEQVAQSIQDAMPIIPTQTLPPSMDAILGYASNKNFWMNEDIWRGPEVEPKEEYTNYTHPAFVAAGEKTGMSPERTQYALEQFFTYGNIYTNVVGHGWNAITGQMDEGARKLVEEERILNHPFIRRVARKTDPYYEHGKKIKEIETQAATERYRLTRELDKISQSHYDNPQKHTKRELKDFINSVPKTERRRLWERHFRRGRIQNLPDKRWWLTISGMTTPEAKATAFWNKWRTEPPQKRKEMERYAKRVPNIASGRFYKRLRELKAKEN